MKSPICAVILLLALAQINATAGLECRCHKRYIYRASKEAITDKEKWLDEEEKAAKSYDQDVRSNRADRANAWPGCEAWKCIIERGNDIWKLRRQQLKDYLPANESELEPACLKIITKTQPDFDTEEFSCGFDFPALQRAIDHWRGRIDGEEGNCTVAGSVRDFLRWDGDEWSNPKLVPYDESGITACLVRIFDPATDAASGKGPVIAMVAAIQLLMLIANKLQIVATGPD